MAGKTAYKNNWQKENVDRVNLTMPKGRKEIIQAHGENINVISTEGVGTEFIFSLQKSDVEDDD